jgi:hypothetical protein
LLDDRSMADAGTPATLDDGPPDRGAVADLEINAFERGLPIADSGHVRGHRRGTACAPQFDSRRPAHRWNAPAETPRTQIHRLSRARAPRSYEGPGSENARAGPTSHSSRTPGRTRPAQDRRRDRGGHA